MQPNRWQELDRSGKCDRDLIGSDDDPLFVSALDEVKRVLKRYRKQWDRRLDDALFLHALRKIQGTPQEELKEVWLANTRHWRRHLPADGFEYLRLECARLATMAQESPQQLTFQQQGGN